MIPEEIAEKIVSGNVFQLFEKVGYQEYRKEGDICVKEEIKKSIASELKAYGLQQRREALLEAASRIEKSVNLKNIGQPDVSLINCHLQSRHDALICRNLIPPQGKE